MTKILVAEDNYKWQITLNKILLKINPSYQITIVGTLGEAIEEYEKSQFDLLVTDLRLRGVEADDKSGLILIKMIRKLNPILPTIIVTLYPTDRITRTAYVQLGVNYFLNKVGLDLPTLQEAVKVSLKPISKDQIRKIIHSYFSLQDLRGILFYFDLNFDSLDIPYTDSKKSIIMSMIEYFDRQGNLNELIRKLSEERPNINWFS